MRVDITGGMPVFEKQSAMPVPPSQLWEWHARPGALERLIPPWSGVRVVSATGGMADREVTLSVPIGPVRQRWIAKHVDASPGHSFRDRMVKGPFARWEHTHRFEPAEEGSLLVDHLDWELPMGGVGDGLAGDAVQRVIERTFRFRHRRTREDLELHAGRAPLRFAITGATGLIGHELVATLGGGGHRVDRLVRGDPAPGSTDIRWDPARGRIDAAALEGVDVVVHLAGESVFGRWSKRKKEAILRSRVDGTALLARTLAGLARKPRVLISVSAVGYYGDRGDVELAEGATSGSDFLAGVCRAWEDAARPAANAGIRVVHPRIGVVLSARGGALATMLPAFRAGLGGPVGSGKQVQSWIAMDDLVRAMHHLVWAEDLEGPVNFTAPTPATQAELARTLGETLGRPARIPTPSIALKAAFGEFAAVLLTGQRVLPRKLLASGFRFVRPTLAEALRVELGREEG